LLVGPSPGQNKHVLVCFVSSLRGIIVCVSVPGKVVEAVGSGQISHEIHETGPIVGGVPPCMDGVLACPEPISVRNKAFLVIA
jgi:hypothetical protein